MDELSRRMDAITGTIFAGTSKVNVGLAHMPARQYSGNQLEQYRAALANCRRRIEMINLEASTRRQPGVRYAPQLDEFCAEERRLLERISNLVKCQ